VLLATTRIFHCACCCGCCFRGCCLVCVCYCRSCFFGGIRNFRCRGGSYGDLGAVEEPPLLESGASGHRPDHVTTTVPRSDEVREEERMLETFGLLTVQMDGRVRLPVLLVRTEVARQLHILPDALGVARLSEASFLLIFNDQQHRNSARNKVHPPSQNICTF
jgi:hypothetical protein